MKVSVGKMFFLQKYDTMSNYLKQILCRAWQFGRFVRRVSDKNARRGKGTSQLNFLFDLQLLVYKQSAIEKNANKKINLTKSKINRSLNFKNLTHGT